ncbi:MAG: hypothetical protein ACLFNN_03525 [Candidatus Paceibacterota bacterium]
MIKEKSEKLKKLMEDKRDLYHTQDLAVLWGIDNPNTLYTTIRRYVARGYLNRIYKGYYSTVPLSNVNPFELGVVALHEYGYVSTESVLVEHGVITQEIKYVTLVSSFSKRIEIDGIKYLVRKMKDDYRLNREGVELDSGVRKATVERAVADMLYFNPNYHFDGKDFINWKRVKEIQKIVGY